MLLHPRTILPCHQKAIHVSATRVRRRNGLDDPMIRQIDEILPTRQRTGGAVGAPLVRRAQMLLTFGADLAALRREPERY